jgi:hypothetical protein
MQYCASCKIIVIGINRSTYRVVITEDESKKK